VNGLRIEKGIILKTGDIIVQIFFPFPSDQFLIIFYQSLGSRIARNEKTPAYITDFHLRPVIAKVSLTGVSP
jgi:hypothetical protein